MNWIKKKLTKPEFELTKYGKLRLNKNRSGCYWFGRVSISNSENPIELTFEVGDESEPSKEQILLFENIDKNWETINEMLIEHLFNCFRSSKWEKGKEELKKMYFLSAIDLKRDKSEFWIVMEPDFKVDTIFNFLPRFTIKNNEIIWSNLK